MLEEATFYDYLIIGAGIAGCTLALELQQKDKSVAIIDNGNPNSSSRVAAGMMNPMVPRNVQKAWKCDEIYPRVFEYYEHWEQKMGAHFIHRIPTLQVHKNPAHTKNWNKRSRENGFHHHLSPVDAHETQDSPYGLPLPYGAAICHLSGKLDVSIFLEACYSYFKEINIKKWDLPFEHQALEFQHDLWQYKNLKTRNIVFAEGIGLYQNPYFNFLPLGATGGDLLEMEIQGLPQDFILKRKEWIIPIGNSRWIGGSTYHNDSTDTQANPEDAQSLIELFKEWIPQEIQLIRHRRAARPTVSTWRPFLGKHPQFQNMFIYNGLGSKGSSLVSYLSPKYADYLCHDSPLPEEVDIARF